MLLRNKAWLAALPLIGAVLSRWHGGGFIGGSPKILKAFLWSVPFAALSAFVHWDKDWWIVASIAAAVLAFTMVFRNTGHGGGMDLAHSPKEPGAGRTPERLEYLILWLHGRMPQYWYDFLLMAIIGLFGALPLAIALWPVNMMAALVLVIFGTVGKCVSYANGWIIYDEVEDIFPKDLEEATAIGEFLYGFFAVAAIAAMFGAFAAAKIKAFQAINDGVKYKEGGEVGFGGSHEAGGSKFYAEDGSGFEAEKGEYITKKSSYRKYRKFVEAFNKDDFSGLSFNDFEAVGLFEKLGVSLQNENIFDAVNEAKAQAKANSTIKLSVDSIFKSLNEKTNGLLKTSLGKKTEIYVESLFAELNEKQKKAYRKKLRNTTFSLLDSICKAKEEKKQNELKTLVSAFNDFYKQVYKIHDFSFASIASENTKDTKKEILTKGLNIVKNFK